MKLGIAMVLPTKGLSTTRSAVCLQSSNRDQAVRHAISGNDIINLENSDTGEFKFEFYFIYYLLRLFIYLSIIKFKLQKF